MFYGYEHAACGGIMNPPSAQENHQLSRNVRFNSLPTDEVDNIATSATAATVIATIA